MPFSSLILFLSCADPLEPPLMLLDQTAYLKAMESPAPSSALKECSKISASALKGECVLFAAKSQAKQKRPALGFCQQAPTEAWKAACYFEVSDMAGLTGSDADAACALAGDFRERCMYHALQREEGTLSTKYPPGEETDLILAIQSRMEKLGIETIQGDPLDVTLTAKIISRRFQAEWRRNSGYLFGASVCGSAPPIVCQEAYRLSVKMISQNRIPEPCLVPMSTEDVLAAHLPIWEASFSSYAQEAWSNLCRRSQGGNHRPPDHRASSEPL